MRKPTKNTFVFLLGILCGLAVSYILWCQFLAGPSEFNIFSKQQVRKDVKLRWAEQLELEGVPNLHRVSSTLYRGAQPTSEGMKNLKATGIRTIINLRWFHSDRDEIGDTEFGYHHITFNPLHPEDKEVVRFLKIVGNRSNQPVFVHCMYGSDRTGMMCAVYRVAVQGWTKEQAIAEWTGGDFGFHDSYQNLLYYFRQLDIQEMKRRAGVE